MITATKQLRENEFLFTPSPLAQQNKEIEKTERIRQIKTWLGSTMKINTLDGRTFSGKFNCLDCYNNIILASTTEYPKNYIPSSEDSSDSKFIGLVMIPSKIVENVIVFPKKEKAIFEDEPKDQEEEEGEEGEDL